MITEWYRNPNRKTPKYKPFSYEESQAYKLNMHVDEYRRRQNIIVTQATDASLAGIYNGAKVWPKDPQYVKDYGQCRVIGVARTVQDLGVSEWPASDVPLIIHAAPIKGGAGFFATVSFFSKEEPVFESEHAGD